jgi:N-dimethylarginine dimethylaminohydrolase
MLSRWLGDGRNSLGDSEAMQVVTPTSKASGPTYLVCPTDHFAVSYSINPWMEPNTWAEDPVFLRRKAKQQWDDLVATLTSSGASVQGMLAHRDVPDLVFTANAAVILDRNVLLSRFRHPERQREQPIYQTAFEQMATTGLFSEIVPMPDNVLLEGAGDCIWDPVRRLFWMGHGFRSEISAAAVVERTFGTPTIPLELRDARFYHLDTALCALPCGGVLHYPGAFTPLALEILYAEVAPESRLTLDEAEASSFAANAVAFGQTIVMSTCSVRLRRVLEERGYTIRETPLDAFLRSGGSACCLTLRLDHRSAAASAQSTSSAA